jgi:ABC-type anion transport system duplicated permease subunit
MVRDLGLLGTYPGMRRGGLTTLVVAIYLAIGIVVAISRDYFQNVEDVKDILSAILAVILWPLVLARVNLHLK